MNKPKLVGITGGIGAGKSTVARIFSILGVPVYDADTEAKNLMMHDASLVKAIKKTFGEESYTKGTLNRAWLAEKVFSSEQTTNQINAIVHPAVANHFSYWAENQNATYVLKEAALLFESGSYKQLHFTILVTSPLESRISRIKARDPHRTESQIKAIMAKQISEAQARELADAVIINDDQHLLIPQVLALHNRLTH